jgi:hypothetical protein
MTVTLVSPTAEQISRMVFNIGCETTGTTRTEWVSHPMRYPHAVGYLTALVASICRQHPELIPDILARLENHS